MIRVFTLLLFGIMAVLPGCGPTGGPLPPNILFISETNERFEVWIDGVKMVYDDPLVAGLQADEDVVIPNLESKGLGGSTIINSRVTLRVWLINDTGYLFNAPVPGWGSHNIEVRSIDNPGDNANLTAIVPSPAGEDGVPSGGRLNFFIRRDPTSGVLVVEAY